MSAVTIERQISDADEIREFLVAAYGTDMRISSSEKRYSLHHRRTDAGELAVDTLFQSADLDCHVEPLRKLVVCRPVSGRLERSHGPVLDRYGPADLFIMSQPDQPYRARWFAGQLSACVIDPAAVAKVAETAPSRRSRPIEFTGLHPLSAAGAEHWWTTKNYVDGLLANPGAAAQPLLISSATRLMAAMTLAVFPNNALVDPTIEDRHDAHSVTVRRAIGFIEANAARDISAADIAAAAGTTIRAVQLAFRRHLNITPMRYLRRIRLEHAHRDLVASDPRRETVSSIAARWGFASHSRFTSHYHANYGVPPSTTLHRH